jgi:peroxiredoxin Q/BCP
MTQSKYAPGTKAPLFTLTDSTGKKFKLSDMKGKKNVLLFFYPGDDTPGCTKQLCALRDDAPQFKKFKDLVIYGVNHANAHSHNAFIEKYGLTLPLLIDTDRKVSEKYGAIKYMFGNKSIRRSVIIVDKNGKLAYVKRGMPSNEEIREALTHLQ